MIKILIADDSLTESILLQRIFEEEKDMQVVGFARDGREAVKLAQQLKPDIITMDINMPIMDGFEATQLIMMSNPIPIVVISSTLNNASLNTTFRALEAGAVSVIDKPINVNSHAFKFKQSRMVSLIRSMSELKMIKKRFPTRPLQKIQPLANNHKHSHYQILAIGASVGGPQALKHILTQLPANFPIPIAIVQHITVGFLEGFCHWLNEECALEVKSAKNYEVLRAGTVYFAPENYHLEIISNGLNLVACLRKGSPVAGFCPSITVLLRSIAKICGSEAIGMLLTGMGNDGAEGLLDLKQKKAHTLIQDPDSSVVFGMSRVAQSLGAVDLVIELDKMVKYLKRITQHLESSGKDTHQP